MAERSARGMLASLLYEPDLDIKEPWYSKRFGQIAESAISTYNKAKMYTGNKLDDTYTALTNLLKVADSEEAMTMYSKQLEEFASDSLKFGGFSDNIVQADTLKLLGGQKKKMYDDFTTAIDDTSKFINTPEFLDTEEEFVNIQDTMDAKNIKGSVADFLQSEVANANRLYDDMVGGFQFGKDDEVIGTNFTYNNAETNDKESFRKLRLYRDRLTLATKSLAGDGLISAEEAEAILIGDEQYYTDQKNTALRKAEKNYDMNQARVIRHDELMNTAIQNKIKKDEGKTDYLRVDINSIEDETDAATLKEAMHFQNINDWDGLIGVLKNKKAEYAELRNIANQNYKNWYGTFYEKQKGGMTEEEIALLNKQLEQEKLEKEKEEKDEEQKKLEETKQRYVELGEEGKVQTYNVNKKEDADNLFSSYVGGNISDEVLRNIGGQSLLNRARVVKNAYKGQLPKATIIPGVETKGITPVNIETLKETKFKNPGKSGTFSWEDISNEIYSGGRAKTEKGTSIAEQYLSDKVDISDLKIRWRRQRDSVEALKNKFKKLGISLKEFKEKYSKDYRTLMNLLAKSRTK